MEYIKGIETDASIEEGYEIEPTCIRANVSADKMLQIIYHFLEMNGEENYDFALNVSLEHYHLSGMYKAMLQAMFEHMEEVLVNDGMSTFSITAANGDILTKDVYNEMHVTSSKIVKRYKKIFEKEQIKRNNDLIFLKDQNLPITSKRYVMEDGTDIYAVVGALKMLGMK